MKGSEHQHAKENRAKEGVLLNIIFIVITLLLLGIPIYLVAQRVESFSELETDIFICRSNAEFVESFGATAPVIFSCCKRFRSSPRLFQACYSLGRRSPVWFLESFLITIAGLAVALPSPFAGTALWQALVERFVKPQIIDKYRQRFQEIFFVFVPALSGTVLPDDALVSAGLTGISYSIIYPDCHHCPPARSPFPALLAWCHSIPGGVGP